MKSENERLWDYIKKGEQNNEFLKTCFEKMFDNMSKKDGNDSSNPKIVNNLQYPNG